MRVSVGYRQDKYMENKKNDIMEYVSRIVEKERLFEYKKSRGTIILKNGFMFQLPKMFNFFRDSWITYAKATMEPEGEAKDLLLRMSNNGVITDGVFSLDLGDVSLMISENGENAFSLEQPIDDEVSADDEGFIDDGPMNFFNPN